MRPGELDRRLRERVEPLGPAPRAELLHVLMLPTSSEPSGSASSGATRPSRTFAELLIDCEEDRTLRAVLVGMLREGPLAARQSPDSHRSTSSADLSRSASILSRLTEIC